MTHAGAATQPDEAPEANGKGSSSEFTDKAKNIAQGATEKVKETRGGGDNERLEAEGKSDQAGASHNHKQAGEKVKDAFNG